MTSTQDELVFLPLGGAGEIGMNLNCYGFGPDDDKKWLLVDCGVTFGDDTTPGIELIMADPSFIEDRADDIVALVVTHAHEDHIGAVPHLWPSLECPVYATPFTANLLLQKLKDVDLAGIVPLNVVPLGGKLDLDPFQIEFVTLTHSIPEPNALAIRTPLGTVLHTGDWKIDPDPLLGEVTDDEALRALGDEGVRAIVCDSTNVFVDGRSGSEGPVKEKLKEVMAAQTGRVIVSAFASNVARVQTIAQAAHELGRHPVLVGRSMHRSVSAARDCGYLGKLPPIMSEEEAQHLPRHKVAYICTGSQGEPRAALARIARRDHRYVTIDEGDAVIFSSRVIPGNEVGIFALQNDLTALGALVITDDDAAIHVSGHPARDELADMYQWVKPEVAIPVHGELRHLKEHERLARDLQVPETVVTMNGGLIRIAPGPAELIDHVPHGRLHMDGDVLEPAFGPALKERRKISFNGYVHLTLAINKKGRVAGDPVLRMKGIPEEDWNGRPTEDLVWDKVDRAVAKAGKRGPNAEDLRIAIRRAVRDAVGKRPLIEVDLIEI